MNIDELFRRIGKLVHVLNELRESGITLTYDTNTAQAAFEEMATALESRQSEPMITYDMNTFSNVGGISFDEP